MNELVGWDFGGWLGEGRTAQGGVGAEAAVSTRVGEVEPSAPVAAVFETAIEEHVKTGWLEYWGVLVLESVE